MVLAIAGGDSIDEGQGLLVIGRGAAHSNTQEKRIESVGSLLGYRGNTEGRETRARQKRQKT